MQEGRGGHEKAIGRVLHPGYPKFPNLPDPHPSDPLTTRWRILGQCDKLTWHEQEGKQNNLMSSRVMFSCKSHYGSDTEVAKNQSQLAALTVVAYRSSSKRGQGL